MNSIEQDVADDMVSNLPVELPEIPELARSNAHRTLAIVLTTLFVMLLLFLILAPWRQIAPGQGRVVAYAPIERQQSIESPVDGRVVKWMVLEGAQVKAGDLIVEVTDVDPAALSRIKEERDALTQRLQAAKLRVDSLDGRIASLTQSRGAAVSAAGSRAKMATERVRQAEQALSAAEAAYKTALLNYDRQRALEQEGLSATRALELAELERVRTSTEVDRNKAALAAARNEENALRVDQDRIGNDAGATLADAQAGRATALSEIAAATAEIARINVRLSRQTAQSVTAPRDGTILRIIAGQGGEIVKAGDPLALFVPATETRAVELWVKGNDAPLISQGRHVRLQFEGWPAIQFTGWPQVAVGTFGGTVTVIDATDNGQGLFRVLVLPDAKTPWPESRYLRQGVRVNGWILLNEVRLGYELWRQWNGFPPSINPPESGATGTKAASKKDGSGGAK